MRNKRKFDGFPFFVMLVLKYKERQKKNLSCFGAFFTLSPTVGNDIVTNSR